MLQQRQHAGFVQHGHAQLLGVTQSQLTRGIVVDRFAHAYTHNIFNMAMATNFNMQNLNQPIGLLVELLGKISFGDR